MKRKHMNHIQDIVRRIQQGDSERRIAKDMQISRGTVHKYFKIAKEKGYLEKTDTQPSESELTEALGPGVQPPRQTSTVEPYREKIQDWVKQGVEMTAIWLRLQENFGYQGGIHPSEDLCTSWSQWSRKRSYVFTPNRARTCKLILGQ